MEWKKIEITEEIVNNIREMLDMTSLTFDLERANLAKHAPEL